MMMDQFITLGAISWAFKEGPLECEAFEQAIPANLTPIAVGVRKDAVVDEQLKVTLPLHQPTLADKGLLLTTTVVAATISDVRDPAIPDIHQMDHAGHVVQRSLSIVTALKAKVDDNVLADLDLSSNLAKLTVPDWEALDNYVGGTSATQHRLDLVRIYAATMSTQGMWLCAACTLAANAVRSTANLLAHLEIAQQFACRSASGDEEMTQ